MQLSELLSEYSTPEIKEIADHLEAERLLKEALDKKLFMYMKSLSLWRSNSKFTSVVKLDQFEKLFNQLIKDHHNKSERFLDSVIEIKEEHDRISSLWAAMPKEVAQYTGVK